MFTASSLGDIYGKHEVMERNIWEEIKREDNLEIMSVNTYLFLLFIFLLMNLRS